MKKIFRNLALVLIIISATYGQPVFAADYDLNTYVYNHLENWDTEFQIDYNNNDVLDVVRNIAKKDDYLTVSLKELVYNKNNGELLVTYKTTKEEEEYIDTELNKIIKTVITANMTDYDKVRAVNKYLIDNVDYDYSLVSNTAYSTLTTKKATCQGYALTAYKMLKLAGIENRIVVGTIDGVGHGWNLVKLNGKWYHLDITNNDATSSDDYFLKGDNILKNKGFAWNNNDYPASNENYYESNGDKSNLDGNWKLINNIWYFTKNTGSYATGWNLINNAWYFLGNDGAMRTGWIYSNSKWYYCYPGSGDMAVNTIIDGYTVNVNGAWVS